MNTTKTIQSALISVFDKAGLEPIVRKLHEQNVTIYSTGGTEDFIKKAINDDRVIIKIKGDFNTEPSPLTDINSPAFKRMEEAVYQTLDNVIPVPYVMLGASDSRNYRSISNGVVNFTPLMNSKGFHGIDERLPIKDFQRSINFFTSIITGSGKPFAQ